MSPARLVSGIALLLTLSACGDGDDARGSQSALPAAGEGTTSTGAVAGDGCPETAPWQRCSVEKRIERSGLVATASDSVRRDYLSVPGLRYELGRGELFVFHYADSTARRRDTERLDPTRAAPPGQAGGWSGRATLITSDNLAAVLLTGNETLLERVQLSLGAGLPR